MLDAYIEETGITHKECRGCKKTLPVNDFIAAALKRKDVQTTKVNYTHRPSGYCKPCVLPPVVAWTESPVGS